MLQNANVRRYDRTSEPPIDGFILAPHLVQNGRTKEQFILGGADDGSIAFWHAEYVPSTFHRLVLLTIEMQHAENVCTLGYFYNPSPACFAIPR